MLEHIRTYQRWFNSNFVNFKAQIKRGELRGSTRTQYFYTGSLKSKLHPVCQENWDTWYGLVCWFET